jgi:hypothetical protein
MIHQKSWASPSENNENVKAINCTKQIFMSISEETHSEHANKRASASKA